jgi:serine/threonine protein kinase
MYLAPEVILNRGHDKGADHWSFGVLIYEMIEGKTPFYKDGMSQIKFYECICEGVFEFSPKRITSPEVEDLIQRLLVVDPKQRIGSLANGINEIYAHPWFKGINFGKLRQKEIEAPWIPEVKNTLDVTNFESWDHLEDKTKSNESLISAVQQKIFKSF